MASTVVLPGMNPHCASSPITCMCDVTGMRFESTGLRPRFPVASSKAGCDRRVPKRPRPGKISAQCRAAQCRAAQCRAAQCRVRPSAVRPKF